MRQVNLLPQAARVRAAKQQAISVYVVAALLSAGAVFGAWYILRVEVQSVQEAVASKREQEAAQQAQAAKREQSLGLTSDLQARITALNSMSQSEIDWNAAFGLVGRITPKDTVLATYGYSVTAGVVTLKITGSAPSNLSFATFRESLSSNTTDIISSKVDGFVYDPKTGRITFGVTLVVKPSSIQYAHGS